MTDELIYTSLLGDFEPDYKRLLSEIQFKSPAPVGWNSWAQFVLDALVSRQLDGDLEPSFNLYFYARRMLSVVANNPDIDLAFAYPGLIKRLGSAGVLHERGK